MWCSLFARTPPLREELHLGSMLQNCTERRVQSVPRHVNVSAGSHRLSSTVQSIVENHKSQTIFWFGLPRQTRQRYRPIKSSTREGWAGASDACEANAKGLPFRGCGGCKGGGKGLRLTMIYMNRNVCSPVMRIARRIFGGIGDKALQNGITLHILYLDACDNVYAPAAAFRWRDLRGRRFAATRAALIRGGIPFEK